MSAAQYQNKDGRDSLDDLFTRLDAATFESIPHKSPMRPRPPTQPPPPRRASPSSSRSRLSTQSSSRSIHSLASAHGSITPSLVAGERPGDAASIRSVLSGTGPPDPHEGAEDASTPSPPQSLPRTTIASPSPSVRASSSQYDSATPPLRLVPRSARSERTPREELASFRDLMAGGSGSEDEDWGGGEGRSVHSLESRGSFRAKRETEPVAAELRIRTSREAVERSSLERSREAGVGEERGEAEDSETRSLASAGSVYGAGGIWPQAPASSSGSVGGTSIGRESMRERSEREKERDRPRQRELREWSQTCWVWTREKSSGGGSGMLGKAPLIREVPAAMKRKMGKRDSSQLLSPAEMLSFDDPKGTKTGSVREKSSKATVAVGPGSSTKEGGSWKRVTGVLRDDGYFRVFSEEKVILHSVHLPSVLRTDIHPVDHSLFGRPHCIVLHRRQISPSTPSNPNFTSFASSTSPSYLSRTSEEPLYLCMPSTVAGQTWIVMAHCFARPEFFLGAVPRPRNRSEAPWQLDDVDDEVAFDGAGPTEADSRCRIFRSVHISINEGRGIGEPGSEVVRPPPKAAAERRAPSERENSTPASSVDNLASNGVEGSPGRASSTSSAPATRIQPRGGEFRERDESTLAGIDTFCEIVLEGDVVARTSVRKGTTSPFWNEAFTFSDLAPFRQSLLIKIFQTHKNSRPTLLGISVVRVPDLPRSELIEDWWCVKPVSHDLRGKTTDTVGELSLSVRIDEEVVLPSAEYQPMLDLLNDDADAELATDIAHEFPTELEEVAKLLLRVYQAESQLLPRILRLAEMEIDGDLKSAAILFRGNSILTKSIELYLRLVGTDYLEASIGKPVRKLCAAKVDIEIDPTKMRVGSKDKDLQHNVQELREWTLTVWNAIYDAREKCPNEVRQIFSHIQRIVCDKYGEELKNMRSTAISAFIFLRFFVPAVLNPKLFSLVDTPPDPKSQRALTLVAKSLQGLANFSSFGLKESFMAPMNSFVQENTSAFVDFIEHISTPSPSAHFEWTSPKAAAYLAPYRLRNSLSPLVREGVPLLPHLTDLPRDLGLLASHIARGVLEKGSHLVEGSGDTPSVSSTGRRSAKYTDFSEACADVHEEARRRGGGLVAPLHTVPVSKLDPKTRARSATVRTKNTWGRTAPTTPPRNIVEEIHIRAPGASPGESEMGSLASRRSHRSYTISGIPGRQSGFNLKSLSTDDLTSPPSPADDDVFSVRRPPATSPTVPLVDGDPDALYTFPARTPVKISQEVTTTVTTLPPLSNGENGGPFPFSFPLLRSDAQASRTSLPHSAVAEVSVGLPGMARRGSTPGMMMNGVLGEDPFPESGKRKGFLAKMGRKNSRVG